MHSWFPHRHSPGRHTESSTQRKASTSSRWQNSKLSLQWPPQPVGSWGSLTGWQRGTCSSPRATHTSPATHSSQCRGSRREAAVVVDVVVGLSVTMTGTSKVVMENGDGLGSADGVGVTLVADKTDGEEDEGEGEGEGREVITDEDVRVADSDDDVVAGLAVVVVGVTAVGGVLVEATDGLAGLSATTVSWMRMVAAVGAPGAGWLCGHASISKCEPAEGSRSRQGSGPSRARPRPPSSAQARLRSRTMVPLPRLSRDPVQ